MPSYNKTNILGFQIGILENFSVRNPSLAE